MQAMREGGKSRNDAIYEAGLVRLRPILMTSIAMIMGTVPIALGFGEAAKSRTAMGIAIIGGLILSTIVTLVVVPSIFGFIDRFREWIESKFRPEYDMNASLTQHEHSSNGQEFYKKEWAVTPEVKVELPKKSVSKRSKK